MTDRNFSTLYLMFYLSLVKVKVKFTLERYSSTLSLTLALDGVGWSTPRPGRFTPGK